MIDIALVGLVKKSLGYPSREDAIWRDAVDSARGSSRPLAVVDYAQGKHLGWVRGREHWQPEPNRVDWVPRYRCAIATYDDIVEAQTAGQKFQQTWSKAATTSPIANNWYDLWPVGGSPVAGAYGGAARTAVQKADTTTGALYFLGNKSPDINVITTQWAKSNAAQPTTLIIYDRVLTYEACTITNGNQTMTNGVAAARYISAGQPGLDIMITAETLLGATANAYTQLRYTDQDGNATQVMPVAFGVNVIVSAAAPTATLGARVVSPSVAAATLTFGHKMPLLAGDTGVRLINDYTHSAANTGTLCYVLMHPIATVPLIGTAGLPVEKDHVMQVASLERVYDGACLAFLAFFGAATAATIDGGLVMTWS